MASYYSAQEAQSVFAEANAAYGREEWDAARAGYQKLLDHGFGGADVDYNLGTVCLAQGDLGCAMLHLERARREGGTGSDLEANLALSRTRQLDQVVGAGSDDAFLTRIARVSDANNAALAFLVLWTLGFSMLLARRFVAAQRFLFTVLAAVLLLASIPAGLLLLNDLSVTASVREAVVMSKTLPARDAPLATAKISFEVHAGLRVRLLEHAGSFVRIRLPNGLEGWAEASGVAML